jgi:hypothetical protein
MLEIIAKDQVVSGDGRFGCEAETDAILVFVCVVRWEGKVWTCGGRTTGEAVVVLFVE